MWQAKNPFYCLIAEHTELLKSIYILVMQDGCQIWTCCWPYSLHSLCSSLHWLSENMTNILPWDILYVQVWVSLEWVENLKTVNKLFVDIRLSYFLSSSRITSIPVYILNSKNSEQIYSKWFLNMQRDYFQWTGQTPENEMVTLSKCGRVSLEMYGQFLVIAVHL